MTLLIYWTLLYVHGFGGGWYVLGFVVWLCHVASHECK
jgi:hypothetical protein